MNKCDHVDTPSAIIASLLIIIWDTICGRRRRLLKWSTTTLSWVRVEL